jgi:electron transfer flavoprotein alpha/beta subunit
MNIFVQVWCEIDPSLNVRIDRLTGHPIVDAGDRLWRVSPLGRAGVATASNLGTGNVTAFVLGSDHREALCHALAAGAQRAVQLGFEGDELPVAALADWLKQEKADLVIADRLAGMIAGRLNWAHLAGLEELQLEQGILRAVRFLGRGDREEVTARLPAAVRLNYESPRVPYVSRSRLQAVSKLRIEQLALPGEEHSSLQTGPLQTTRPRTRLGTTPAPTATSASDRLLALMGGGSTSPVIKKPAEKSAATPEEMAEEFVRYLVHHELLPRA